MFDPILTRYGDRAEDLGYLLSNLVEKFVEATLQKNEEKRSTKAMLADTLDMIIFKTGPTILNAYMTLCPELPELYTNQEVPIDFFVAGFLLQKAQLYNDHNYQDMRDILSMLGNQFIEAKPFAELIKSQPKE